MKTCVGLYCIYSSDDALKSSHWIAWLNARCLLSVHQDIRSLRAVNASKPHLWYKCIYASIVLEAGGIQYSHQNPGDVKICSFDLCDEVNFRKDTSDKQWSYHSKQ